MKKLFDYANDYIKSCDWRTIAVLKFCLLSLGILLGLAVPVKHRAKYAAVAGFLFGLTCVPLMIDFLGKCSKD